MGGPGYVNGKRYECMNNFGLASFEINGRTYVSTEAFLQCCKCANDDDHERLRRSNKTGMDIWALGQCVQLRDDWEVIKVDVMLQGIRAKFQQNPNLLRELQSTGSEPIYFPSHSTSVWNHFNAIICMLVREESKDETERDQELIQKLQAEIDEYRRQRRQEEK